MINVNGVPQMIDPYRSGSIPSWQSFYTAPQPQTLALDLTGLIKTAGEIIVPLIAPCIPILEEAASKFLSPTQPTSGSYHSSSANSFWATCGLTNGSGHHKSGIFLSCIQDQNRLDPAVQNISAPLSIIAITPVQLRPNPPIRIGYGQRGRIRLVINANYIGYRRHLSNIKQHRKILYKGDDHMSYPVRQPFGQLCKKQCHKPLYKIFQLDEQVYPKHQHYATDTAPAVSLIEHWSSSEPSKRE